jgi:galactokinase
MREFRAIAPGRLCLFGEHSDYIGLDVIPSAIDMFIQIDVQPRSDDIVTLNYLDLQEKDEFKIGNSISYRHKRDYIRSAFKVLPRKGIKPRFGADLSVSGNIPIAGGLSSSSALAVAATLVVSHLSEMKISNNQLARLAYQVEVVEFGESGGMQDHFASAYGGIIHLNLGKDYDVTRIPARLDSLVIGDSLEKKRDTVGDIKYIKTTVENEYEKIGESIPHFDKRTTTLNEVYSLRRSHPNNERRMAEATLRNRDLTKQAFSYLLSKDIAPKEIGMMLSEHHEILRDGLQRSTDKIERMIEAAYDAGALGCKINGSGGGGTMMAYSNRNHEDIASAIERSGGKAYVVRIADGATITTLED